MLINQYKDNKRDGHWEHYYSNGKLMCKGNYKNDKEDGPWEAYRNNGELYSKGTYKDNKRVGYWYVDGKQKFYVN